TCLRIRILFFFSSRRRHTRSKRDWSSDVCSSDLAALTKMEKANALQLVATNGSLTLRQTLMAVYNGQITATTALTGLWTKAQTRSEERRVGKEWRSRGAGEHSDNKELAEYGE